MQSTLRQLWRDFPERGNAKSVIGGQRAHFEGRRTVLVRARRLRNGLNCPGFRSSAAGVQCPITPIRKFAHLARIIFLYQLCQFLKKNTQAGSVSKLSRSDRQRSSSTSYLSRRFQDFPTDSYYTVADLHNFPISRPNTRPCLYQTHLCT